MIKNFMLADNKQITVYMQDNYTAAMGKLPCIIQSNGVGENGDDGDISLMYKNSFFHQLKDGAYKPEGVIVVGLFPPKDFPDPIYLTQALDSMLHLLPIDPHRVVATGYSAGAQVWVEYCLKASSFVRRLAGLILMSVTEEPCKWAVNSPYMLSHLKSIPIWWLHGDQDVSPHSWAKAKLFYDTVVKSGNTRCRFTTLKGVGHGGWNTMTSPNFASDPNNTYKQSLWDWAKSFGTATAFAPLEHAPHAAFSGLKEGETGSELTSQSEDRVQVLRSPEPVDRNDLIKADSNTAPIQLHALVDSTIRQLVNGIHAHYQQQNLAQVKAAKSYEPKTEEQTMQELTGGGSQEGKTTYQQKTDNY